MAEVAAELLEPKEGKTLEESARVFLDWLNEQHELHRLPDVLRALDDVWKARFGSANVWVATAHPLSREARKALEHAARGATLTDTVDANLIGGARVRIDDRVVDGSLRGALTHLQDTLLQE